MGDTGKGRAASAASTQSTPVSMTACETADDADAITTCMKFVRITHVIGIAVGIAGGVFGGGAGSGFDYMVAWRVVAGCTSLAFWSGPGVTYSSKSVGLQASPFESQDDAKRSFAREADVAAFLSHELGSPTNFDSNPLDPLQGTNTKGEKVEWLFYWT